MDRKVKQMKTLLMTLSTTCLCAHIFASQTYMWASIPSTTEPHAEVSTNVALHVNTERLMEFRLRVAATNTISNEIVVAVGGDANGDGDLSLNEVAFAFCYDCGERKIVNYGTQEIATIAQDTIASRRKDFNPAWDLAKVVKRGPGDMEETITETVENLKFEIRLR